MKRLFSAVLALLFLSSIVGCGMWNAVTDTAKDAVILVDEKAQENEVVVEKLCVDPDSVTEEEKIDAIRTARLISTLTANLRELLGVSEGDN